MNKCCQQLRLCSTGDEWINEQIQSVCGMTLTGETVPTPLCPPQTPHRLAWCWILVSMVTNCLSHGMALLHQNVPSCKEYKTSRLALGSNYTPIPCILGSFPSGRVARERKTTHLYSVLRSRMSAPTPLLPVHAFTACEGIIF